MNKELEDLMNAHLKKFEDYNEKWANVKDIKVTSNEFSLNTSKYMRSENRVLVTDEEGSPRMCISPTIKMGKCEEGCVFCIYDQIKEENWY